MFSSHSTQETSARWGRIGVLLLFLSLAACGTNNAEPSSADDIEIAGTWASSFGGLETISSDSWANEWLAMTVVGYSNNDNWAVTQNPDDDEFNPSQFNKIVWTEPTDGGFYYCMVAYGQDTADDAQNAIETADDSDPDNTGCGGFGWTKLNEPVPTDPAANDLE